jgi:two-component system sensor histidine kinase/response regulator
MSGTNPPALPQLSVPARRLLQVAPTLASIEVLNLMNQQQATSALVVEHQRLVGIFTERDAVRAIAHGLDLETQPIAELMTSEVVTIDPIAAEDVFQVLQQFQLYQIRHLPVLDTAGQVVRVIVPEDLREALKPTDLLRLRQVSEVMQTEVFHALPTDSVQHLAELMSMHRVSCIVIVAAPEPATMPPASPECRFPIGIVTERDLVRLRSMQNDLSGTQAATVMSAPLVPISPQDSLWQAHQQMRHHKIRRLVVTNRHSQLVGLVTQTNLLKALDPIEMYNVIALLQQTVDDRTTALQQEIQQRQQIQLALHESETRLRETQRLTQMGSWTLDLANRKITWSEGVYRLFGLEPSQPVPSFAEVLQLVHPEDRNSLQQVIDEAIVLGSPFVMEHRLKQPNGSIRHVEVRGEAMTDRQGHVAWLLGTLRDIAERKQAETVLRQQLERDRLLSEISLRIRQSLNLEEILSTAVQEARKVLHCDRVLMYRFNPDWSGEVSAESVGAGWGSLLQEQATEPSLTTGNLESDRCVVKLLSNGSTLQDTYLQATGGGIYNQGTRYLCVNDIYTTGFEDCYIQFLERFQARAYLTVPIFANSRLWGLLSCYQNSAPRQWQEPDVNIMLRIATQLGIALQQAQLLAQTQEQAADLQRAKEAAEAANRAKSTFLSNMSHELRTPLSAILGFTELLRQDTNLTLEQQENLEIISHSGEHLLSLINEVLDLSKVEAGESTVNQVNFDLYELLSNLNDLFQLQAQSKQLQLTINRDRTVPRHICTDEARLRQILINLLGNAVKFTQVGQVKLRVQWEAQPGTTPEAGWLLCEVEDSGSGILSEDLDRIFDPFVQSTIGQQMRQGTGLGLPISRRFARLLGGDLTVESTLGVGSRFRLSLPVQCVVPPERSSAALLRRVNYLAAGQPTYRILIVDDAATNRRILLRLLASLGFAVQEAADGRTAIALWQNWQPHLILMDLRMPEMDGETVVQQIRNQEGILAAQSVKPTRPHPTKILALTASAFGTAPDALLAIGCDDLLFKPIAREPLLEKLAEHLGVRYCYTHQSPAQPPEMNPSASAVQPQLTNALSQMSAAWRTQLQQAALQADGQQILRLLAELPDSQQDIRSSIANLVSQFRFDLILSLTQAFLA